MAATAAIHACRLGRMLARANSNATGLSGIATGLAHTPARTLHHSPPSCSGESTVRGVTAPEWRESRAWGGAAEETREQFGAFAEQYDSMRPGYPPDMFTRIVDVAHQQQQQQEQEQQQQQPGAGHGPSGAGARPLQLVDVASGTGRFALEFAERGLQVTATDSDARMLEVLAGEAARRGVAGRVAVQPATAESLGLPPQSVDVVTAAQSFHWFDAPAALAEFHRVLRPGGIFVAAWNDRDLDEPWVAEFEALIEQHNPMYSRHVKQSNEWGAILTEGGHFRALSDTPGDAPTPTSTPTPPERFANPVGATIEGMVELCHTYSYIKNALSPDELARFDAELRSLLTSHHGTEPFAQHYVTKAFILQAQ